VLSLLLCGIATTVFTLVLVIPVAVFWDLYSDLGHLPLLLSLIFSMSDWFVRLLPVLALVALVAVVTVVRNLPKWSKAWSINKDLLLSTLSLSLALVSP
jgi:type II secretory pathway component PulF